MEEMMNTTAMVEETNVEENENTVLDTEIVPVEQDYDYPDYPVEEDADDATDDQDGSVISGLLGVAAIGLAGFGAYTGIKWLAKKTGIADKIQKWRFERAMRIVEKYNTGTDKDDDKKKDEIKEYDFTDDDDVKVAIEEPTKEPETADENQNTNENTEKEETKKVEKNN